MDPKSTTHESPPDKPEIGEPQIEIWEPAFERWQRITEALMAGANRVSDFSHCKTSGDAK